MRYLQRVISPALLLASFCFAATATQASESETSPQQASQFVQDLGSRAVNLLSRYSKDGGPNEFQSQFNTLVRQSFDLDTIGRFSLGKTWNTATPEQRQEYQKLFALWMVNSYAHRLSIGAAQKPSAVNRQSFKVLDAEPIAGTDALVRTEIRQSDGSSLPVNVRVRGPKENMKIIDLIVGGVSLDMAQRDEFTSVIQRQGLDGLILDLRSRVGTLQAAGK